MTFAATATAVLAQTPSQDVVGTGETVVFWILGPLALVGALGMVFARSAVHSALWLVLTMLCLGVLYMAQSAQFLGFTQIIVYTGAIMMLFLFVLMMVGRDASDSVVEVLRGQRLAAAALGIGFALLLTAGLARSLHGVQPAAPLDPWSPQGGGAGGLGRLIFTDYLFPFELTSALLITAALGAMVLAYGGKGRKPRRTQRETVEARFRGEHARPSPLPGPGVYATANSVATPALLPDGSVAPESLSEILDNTPVERLSADRAAISGHTREPDPRALTGSTASSNESTGRTDRDTGTETAENTAAGTDDVVDPAGRSYGSNGNGFHGPGGTDGDASESGGNGHDHDADSDPTSSEEVRQ
ncbi:NADH dehydrogenase subunit J [Halopolyspora algeriensis]|uniref:NADH-quinone oxidoreductase subunit J n=1 Tax=Halopolyspora algeriensis TaxID=1500506 RepID=A0A368VZK3_9ACTN|nr:NADH-quinone oxidoreductase subunit J [Halopolyspora algeriensis]RCW46859.1 NADH dehydrogenase subunit J [Halopolyspora algeriensis]TQM47950.1 NADH dehydrogenase subunit J [Halopolyspora algeriensis]